ncbi:hypothetical protein BJF93_15375 [Xaviernesmea oryzae]|uniref:Uncharacterized protein n=1 Tax=Xaviernesmea oryzae TaxID=464029 RepID=A0A1Q9AY17_9HYPH|nr:hypothetical protein [Xaviernesmea oryzae]OLP60336.1 hypothetical protein BJF93_15375 [Xaviernesmea oryzae]
MRTFATYPTGQDETSISVERVEDEFQRALKGDAACHGSEALYALQRAISRKDLRSLSAHETERLMEAFDVAAPNMGVSIGLQLDDATISTCWRAVRKTILSWGSRNAFGSSTTSSADTAAWVRIARNAMHNASLMGEIEERSRQRAARGFASLTEMLGR